MRSSLSLSLLLMACGSSSPSAPAEFGQATEAQLQRTIMAATSLDTVFVSFIAAGYAGEPDGSGCPSITTEGDRRHVVGGCTTEDGERIEGELFLDNVPGLFEEPDPTAHSKIEANGFLLSDPQGDIVVDGTLSWVLDGATDAALDVELAGINVHSDTRISCPDGACSYERGTIDVEGLGSGTLKGTFSYVEAAEASIDVVGKDTLSIHNDGSCLTYTVGTRHGLACNE